LQHATSVCGIEQALSLLLVYAAFSYCSVWGLQLLAQCMRPSASAVFTTDFTPEFTTASTTDHLTGFKGEVGLRRLICFYLLLTLLQTLQLTLLLTLLRTSLEGSKVKLVSGASSVFCVVKSEALVICSTCSKDSCKYMFSIKYLVGYAEYIHIYIYIYILNIYIHIYLYIYVHIYICTSVYIYTICRVCF